MAGPPSLAGPIREWTRRNQDATRAGHRAALVEIAAEFRANVDDLLQARRQPGAAPRNDVINGLLETRIDGTPLTDEEITGILRNWTMGSWAASRQGSAYWPGTWPLTATCRIGCERSLRSCRPPSTRS